MQVNHKIKELALSILLSTGAVFTAHAGSAGAVVPVLATYQQECAACHMPYPPGLLPAASWQRIMGGLGKHFGVDASLDAASLREISDWLRIHAATYKRVSEEPPQDRITKSTWFLRKHQQREVAPAVWKRAAVGSPANCVACHGNAALGNFNERDIKVPQ